MVKSTTGISRMEKMKIMTDKLFEDKIINEISEETFTYDESKIPDTDIVIMPRNIDNGLFTEDSISLYKEIKNSGKVSIDFYGGKDNFKGISINSADLWLPVIWIGTNVVLPLALNAFYDFVKSKIGNKDDNNRVHVTIKHKNKTSKHTDVLKYNGNGNGLKTALKSFEKVTADE
jgi:hypothetical protein